MARAVLANVLCPGMVVSHAGWLDAATRHRIEYRVTEVSRPDTKGGWKSGRGKRAYTMLLDPVRVDYVTPCGRAGFFVVDSHEVFRLERQHV